MTDAVWRIDRDVHAHAREVYGCVATGDAVFGAPCGTCGRRPVDFGAPPVSVRWLRGEPAVLADLVWPKFGLGEVLVSPRIATAVGGLDGVRLEPIALGARIEDPSTGRSRGTVPTELHDQLAAYHELRADVRANVLFDASTFETGPGGAPCSFCGRASIKWAPPGPRSPGVPQPPVTFMFGCEYLERTSTEIDARDELVLTFRRHPAIDGEGAAFSRREVGAAHVWRPAQYPTALLCTTAFKRAVEAASATNVAFLRVGRLVG